MNIIEMITNSVAATCFQIQRASRSTVAFKRMQLKSLNYGGQTKQMSFMDQTMRIEIATLNCKLHNECTEVSTNISESSKMINDKVEIYVRPAKRFFKKISFFGEI